MFTECVESFISARIFYLTDPGIKAEVFLIISYCEDTRSLTQTRREMQDQNHLVGLDNGRNGSGTPGIYNVISGQREINLSPGQPR